MKPDESESPKEKCGVFGVFGNDNASALVALGLHALQHRGQESCGIVSCDDGLFYSRNALGLVDNTFSDVNVINALKGSAAIGHNRYSTTGETSMMNIQPFVAELSFGNFAIAHNGNITNMSRIRKTMVDRGAIFHTTTDTEVIIHLMAFSRQEKVTDRLIDALHQIEGAYSLVAMSKNMMIGVRDPHGIRPLSLGKLGDSYILASESCAFDIIGAEYIREIEAGEMVCITGEKLESLRPFEKKSPRFCIFEYVYFARPDSFMENLSVYEVRKNIGKTLAKESPVKNADCIVPVPDSGVPAAIGFAEESKIPFELGIIRNHYIGRTFIEPTDQIRHLGVKLKHNANRAYIENKNVVLVDDSIVRGTTSKKIVDMVRNAGAKEVHMRISSPPTINSCYYGIDTPSQEKLLAHTHNVQEIADYIGVDSLAYISLDALYSAVLQKQRNLKCPQFCDACFSGDYPIKVDK